MRSRLVLAMVLAGGPAVYACSSTNNGGDDTIGVAAVELSRVPDDVGCIRIRVEGSAAVTRSFDVQGGKEATLSMNHLPLGDDAFSAEAYSGSCANVQPAATPTWISDAVHATVTVRSVAHVKLVMHRSARGVVSVDFPDGGPEAGLPQALCPITSSFPAGTYRISTIDEVRTDEYDPALPSQTRCRSGRGTATLTLSVNIPDPNVTAIVKSSATVLSYGMLLSATDNGGPTIHYEGTSSDFPDSARVSFDIDPSTGFVTNFSYWVSHLPPYFESMVSTATGTGWLSCPASESAPPPVPLPPEPATACSGKFGCTYTDVSGGTTDSCPASLSNLCSATASCENHSYGGYLITCCPS